MEFQSPDEWKTNGPHYCGNYFTMGVKGKKSLIAIPK